MINRETNIIILPIITIVELLFNFLIVISTVVVNCQLFIDSCFFFQFSFPNNSSIYIVRFYRLPSVR